MMSETDTKTRILDAAERLFAANGLDGVSLRAVTGEAGVNLAAVNYHFGTKEALLAEMGRRFFDAMTVAQAHALDALDVTENPPTVDALLAAYAAPVFAQFDAHRGLDWTRIWMLTRSDRPGRGMFQLQSDAGASVTRRYVAALRRVVPHLPPDELAWRFERATSLLMANQGKHLAPPGTLQGTEPAAPDERAWLLAFLAGGLLAPATTAGASPAPDSP